MHRSSSNLYPTPFCRDYWRDAVRDFKSLRCLTFAALMIAICIVLSGRSVSIYPGISISFGYLARSLCGLVCGPVTAVVFSVAEDNLSFFLNGGGAYFPGYTLTTVLGTVIYALFFYRARVTVARIFLAKLCNNILNVFLGGLWSAILYGKSSLLESYLTYVGGKLVSNAIQLPVQVLLLTVLFGAMLPILGRTGLLPAQNTRRISLR